MPAPSDPRFLVLHGLRLKGFAEAQPMAEATGLDPAVVDSQLEGLAADELVLHRTGRVSGWSLTAAGRAEHARAVTAELEAAGARPVVDAAYRCFLGHNGELLAVCTAWQLRDEGGAPAPNDHTDAAYDEAVVERLAGVHEQVRPVVGDLASTLDRFGRYEGRLATALDRVRAGGVEWLTKPVIDSYHTVWFELHEDLLSTLGIERGSERAGEQADDAERTEGEAS
ncbi:MAG: MarR family transcriptional regulator [Acidimicrobiia bacterium]|nr:MarR family transcriptional regulator [Acidimicrobiia bacterium]